MSLGQILGLPFQIYSRFVEFMYNRLKLLSQSTEGTLTRKRKQPLHPSIGVNFCMCYGEAEEVEKNLRLKSQNREKNCRERRCAAKWRSWLEVGLKYYE